jgi:hypothetical protein
MTKFMNKSFSVYANYEYVPTCTSCGKEGIIFYQSLEGRVCQNCHAINKLKRQEKRLDVHQTKS